MTVTDNNCQDTNYSAQHGLVL